MSKEINHWCVVCGKGYHACDSCAEVKSFAPWRLLTDTSEHFKIFMVLRDYNNRVIDKTQARNMLDSIDLSGKNEFKDSAKNLLAEIFEEDIPTKSNAKKNNKKAKEIIEDSIAVLDKSEDKNCDENNTVEI